MTYLQEENIVTLYDVPNIWHVPLLLKVSSVINFKTVYICTCSSERLENVLFLSLFPTITNRIRRHMKQSWKGWTFKGLFYSLTHFFSCLIYFLPLLPHLLSLLIEFDCVKNVYATSRGIFFFQWPINISIICSVAREPELEEWTARTKVFDTLHDPVGQRHLIHVLIPIYLYNLKNNVRNCHLYYRLELPWLENTQAFQILTFLF